MQHFNNFAVLLAGRLVGGIATSILCSNFESWLVCEHHKVCCSPHLCRQLVECEWLTALECHFVIDNSLSISLLAETSCAMFSCLL